MSHRFCLFAAALCTVNISCCLEPKPSAVLDVDYTDHGVYHPNPGSSHSPSYEYFSPHEGSGILQIEYWTGQSNEQRFVDFQLDFIPTAISGNPKFPSTIFMGGLTQSGSPILVEYSFDFEGDFKLGKKTSVFGDVTALTVISDCKLRDKEEPVCLLLLDGKTGLFGQVKRCEVFRSLVSPSLSTSLQGMLSFTPAFKGTGKAIIAFSPMPCDSDTNAPPGATLYLRSFIGEDEYAVVDDAELHELIRTAAKKRDLP